MNWMDKLERKWGRHAVANLSRYFVLAQVIGYVVQLTAPGLMSYMNFDMGSILHGQLWRVVTWILHRRHRWMFLESYFCSVCLCGAVRWNPCLEHSA